MVFGQGKQDSKGLVQFSGVVLTSDSLQGLPFATVIIKGSGRGTMTNYQGFFSLVAAKGDHVIFTTVGFKTHEVVIPDTLQQDKYSIIAMMSHDDINLGEVIIYPWPTKEEFRQAFLSLNIPDDEIEIAKKNLDKERLRMIGDMMPTDGGERSTLALRQEAAKFYYAGQVPPMNIFNPIAWANFIKAWKNGDFKKKKGIEYQPNYRPVNVEDLEK